VYGINSEEVIKRKSFKFKYFSNCFDFFFIYNGISHFTMIEGYSCQIKQGANVIYYSIAQ
jgi:hypothetical protein